MVTMAPGYKIPRDRAKIWRYMDFTGFMSLLDKRSLFFALICNLNDPMEGVYPDANRQAEYAPQSSDDSPEERMEKVRRRLVDRHEEEQYRKQIAVNCWHVNENESVAMWKTYVESRQGIAIQSTCGRLIRSLDLWRSDVIQLAKVKYIRGPISGKSVSLFESSLHKRKSYEYEKELRAFVFRPRQTHDPDFMDSSTFQKHGGTYIDVCLEELIGKVYVSPIAQEWFKNLVQSVMTRYSVKAKLIKSDLAMSGSLY